LRDFWTLKLKDLRKKLDMENKSPYYLAKFDRKPISTILLLDSFGKKIMDLKD